MKKKGFTFIEPKFRIPAETIETNSLAYAQQYGFGLSATFTVRRPDPWLGEEQLDLRKSASFRNPYAEALNGNQKQKGCLAESSEAQLGLTFQETNRIAEKVNASVTSFEQSTDAKSLVSNWKGCISQLGYEANDINGLRTIILTAMREAQKTSIYDEQGKVSEPKVVEAERELAKVQTQEIDLAVQEFRCRDNNYQKYLKLRSEIALGAAGKAVGGR